MITVSIIYGPHTIWNPNFWLHEPSWSLAAIFGFLNLVVLWIFLNCDPCCLKELRKITPKVLHIFKQKKQLTCPPRCNSVRCVQQRLPMSPAFPCSPPPPTLPCVRFCRCRAGEWGAGEAVGVGRGVWSTDECCCTWMNAMAPSLDPHPSLPLSPFPRRVVHKGREVFTP